MQLIAPMLALALSALSALGSAPLPADAIESRRVHDVVQTMQTAIERDDAGAFMAVIDPSDPVLITEHRAWFVELAVSPVDDLTIAIDPDEPLIRDDDGSVVAPLTITWQVPSEDKPRRYDLPARFAPLASPNGQWHFTGRAWDIALLDTPGVRIYCDEQHADIAQLTLQRVPEIRNRIAADMGIDPAKGDLHEVVVKIYPKMSELQASIYPSYTNGISGWNEPGESIKILGRDEMPQDRLDPLLAHEIGHAVSFEYGPQINFAPWWTLEGVAEVAAGLFRDSWESRNNRIARLAHKDDLRDWHLLADFKGEAVNHARHVYLQGWSMIDYIDRTFGKDARNAWFIRLGHAQSLDEATKEVMKVSFDQLSERWKQALLDHTLPQDDQSDSDR